MKFWVGITDKRWFEFLRERSPDEVNFWQPSGRALTSALVEGAPFLFKLHSPDNFIVGGGYFVRFTSLPAMLAWEAFNIKNGVETYAALRARVLQYRGEPFKGDPEIGCNILAAPFFFEQSDWIPIPEDWGRSIVRGKTYDTSEATGNGLWNQVTERLTKVGLNSELEIASAARYGADYLTRARLGQGAFRVLVTDAYQRRCAITGEKTLPVLQAAHIRPFALEGPHRIDNGLLLRSDLHTLFDLGYLTVTDDLKVEVSQQIRSKFENGREYYKHQGQSLLIVPESTSERPAKDFLRWHQDNVFVS